MNHSAKVLLSICIPTYNRANYLESCLLSIFSQLEEDMSVEIVVSNNKSTDHTTEIIDKYLDNKCLNYFEQDLNIGFAHNVLSVVKKASGEYCWIIGDDDFLIQGALKAVLDLIKKDDTKVDYYYASEKGFHLDSFNKYSKPFHTSKMGKENSIQKLDYQRVGKFEEIIGPDYSIIFLGELMVSIFKRDIWLSYTETSEFDYEFLENLETTYPHSVVLANTFFGKEAIFIKTPLLLCLDGARDWWDKLGYILIEQVKNLLDLYQEKGLSPDILRKCHRSYIQMTFKPYVKFMLNPKSKYRNRINFSRYTLFLAKNPLLLLSYLKNVISARSRGPQKK